MQRALYENADYDRICCPCHCLSDRNNLCNQLFASFHQQETNISQYISISQCHSGLWLLKVTKKESERKKKLDRQWLELNIVLPGRKQHPLRGYIFYTEIIASVLLCMCFRVSVFHFSPCDREPEVVCLLGNCFLEVAPFLQTCLI